jgi:N-acetylmuramoyl-L-alanine amidase
MFWKRHKRSSSRHLLSSWGIRARFFWYRLEKTPLIVVLVLGAVATGFGLLLHSMSANSANRRSVMCLAMNVYFEARGEPEVGQYAVAEVTLNRVASRYYPDTICGVVYQKNWDPLRKRYVAAFSWTEFQSVREPHGKEWRRAWKIAEEVYYERREPKLAGVLNYHADRVEPSWSQGKKPTAEIGKHRFYK